MTVLFPEHATPAVISPFKLFQTHKHLSIQDFVGSGTQTSDCAQLHTKVGICQDVGQNVGNKFSPAFKHCKGQPIETHAQNRGARLV